MLNGKSVIFHAGIDVFGRKDVISVRQLRFQINKHKYGLW